MKEQEHKVFDPSQVKKEEPVIKSRKQRKAEKEIGRNIDKILDIFFTFKLSHKNQDGEEVADKFEELNEVWKKYCHAWTNSPKRMKLAGSVSPNIKAFEGRVEEFVARIPKTPAPAPKKKNA